MTEMKRWTQTEYVYAVRTGTRNGMILGFFLGIGAVAGLLALGLLVNV